MNPLGNGINSSSGIVKVVILLVKNTILSDRGLDLF